MARDISWGAFIGLATSVLLVWLRANKLWHLEFSEKRDTTPSSLLSKRKREELTAAR